MEKNQLISQVESIQYQEDCPIIINKINVEKQDDGKIILRCSMENLEKRFVKAVILNIKCFSIDEKELAVLEDVSYLDLEIEQYNVFGRNFFIEVPNIRARIFVFSIQKILFLNNEWWINVNDTNMKMLDYSKRQSLLELGELKEQYLRELETNNFHGHLLYICNNIMICGCNKVVLKEELRCPSCSANFAKLNNMKNEEYLKAKENEYIDNQKKINLEERKIEEKKKIIEHERIKKRNAEEKQHQILLNQKRKKNKLIKTLVSICFIIVIATLIIKLYIIPENIYNNAQEFLNNEQYRDAYEEFIRIGNFKDSEELAKVSEDLATKENIYAEAIIFFKDNKYADAAKHFERLGVFRNSEDMKIEAKYQEAKQYIELKDFEHAFHIFNELEDYKDSDIMKKESLYQYASYLYRNGKIKEAYVIYLDLKEYLDSDKFTKEIINQMFADQKEIKNFIEASRNWTYIIDFRNLSS